MIAGRASLVIAAALLVLAAPAHAQYYPDYPGSRMTLAPAQPYAVEVAPGTYAIRRGGVSHGYPYVDCGTRCGEPGPARRSTHRKRTHNDPRLIEELRRRHAHKRHAIHTTRIVRDPPTVIEHRRVVDDPPRVVERVRYAAGKRARRTAPVDAGTVPARAPRNGSERRVIRAEAEVTILGPDRMSIRLFRKRDGRNAKADADE